MRAARWSALPRRCIWRVIEAGNIDAALLDANLAVALTRAGIPFAFLTAYNREALPGGFRSAPLIAKPFNQRAVLEVVDKLIKRDASVT